SKGVSEGAAKARLGRAFRLREITYRPLRALPYEKAKIDWDTGRVTLRRLAGDLFTPTLSEAEFFAYFLPCHESDDAKSTAQAASRGGDSTRGAPGARTANVMPPDEAEGYTLLWEAAAEISRTTGQSLKRNWLHLMDSFWRGCLAPDGLTYFYPG